MKNLFEEDESASFAPIAPTGINPAAGPIQQQGGNIFAPRPTQSATGIEGFINSPYMAMANQGINNISAMRRDQAPSVSPTQAYQQQVIAQANANQQKKINDLTIQQKQQSMDPFFKFRTAKAEGYIPKEMSYAEFERIGLRDIDSTSPIKNTAEWQRLTEQIEAETDPAKKQKLVDQRSFLEQAVRAPQQYAGGGGSIYSTQPGSMGGPTELVSPEQATSRNVSAAEQEEDATKWASANQAWEVASAEAIPQMDSTISTIDEMIGYLEANPDMDTGMIEGWWTANVSPLVAQMDTLSTILTVPALAAAKLNPVTEQEFESIKSTFASPKKDVAANIASLKANRGELIKKINMMSKMQDHYNNAGTMKGYYGGYQSKYRDSAGYGGGGTGGGGNGTVSGPKRPGE